VIQKKVVSISKLVTKNLETFNTKITECIHHSHADHDHHSGSKEMDFSFQLQELNNDLKMSPTYNFTNESSLI